MSVARGFGLNGKSIYANVCKPEIVFANFTVDATNGNGLGIRSLKSNGYIEHVYMNSTAAFTGTSHTSVLIDGIASGTSSLVVGMPVQGSGIPAGATIASIVSSSSINLSVATSTSTTGSITYQGVGSPNPAAGYALIQFKNNFNYYLGGFSGFVSPVSGTPILVTTGVTAGLSYVIVSVGTTTLAQWQKLGLPLGVTPAVGVSFVAPATTTATGSGVIEVQSNSGIVSVEAIGDSKLSINSNIASNAGQYLLLQFLGATSSSVTTLIPTAPAPGSTFGMASWFDGSSVTVDGI
jgi:hypothetical protein